MAPVRGPKGQSARPQAATAGAVPRKRLTAGARKSSILKAARRVFTETGDMNGTTIKPIAARSGISKGVIYRHFESKDQLFLEAVVEPLKQATDDFVAAAQLYDRDEPLTPERQIAGMTGLYRQLTSTREEVQREVRPGPGGEGDRRGHGEGLLPGHRARLTEALIDLRWPPCQILCLVLTRFCRAQPTVP